MAIETTSDGIGGITGKGASNSVRRSKPWLQAFFEWWFRVCSEFKRGLESVEHTEDASPEVPTERQRSQARREPRPVKPAFKRLTLAESFARDHPVVKPFLNQPPDSTVTLPRSPEELARIQRGLRDAFDWPFYRSLPAGLRVQLEASARQFKMAVQRTVPLEKKSPVKRLLTPAELKAKEVARAKRKSQQARRAREKAKAIRQAVERKIEKHWPALRRNLNQALVRDDYGTVVSDRRQDVFADFLQSMKVDPASIHSVSTLYASTIRRLSDEKRQAARAGFCAESAPANGHEFEHWVANQLESVGWKARATQGSGDQGVDVIAVKNGVEVGIQCKRWKKAVGNKAVQEIYAGIQHLRIHHGAIVATSGYTRGAEELAASTGIHLLLVEDLPHLEELV